MRVDLTWTIPTTRADGTPLALTEIASALVKRNGAVIATLTAVTPSMAFSDTTPLTGADAYTVDTVTVDNLVSGDSNTVNITVPNVVPAAAVIDLAGTLVAP